MGFRTAVLPAVGVALSVVLAAQGLEFARVLRDGEQATLSVFGPRPVDLAAQKLVDEFGVGINVEDPIYVYRDDVQLSHVTASGKRVMVPRAALFEVRVDLRADGSLLDVRQVVRDLVDTANAQMPYLYRIDNDGGMFTLIPSRTRDERGRSIALTPILDRHVTIPPGTRKISEHANLLTQALQQQTGVRISCCQSHVGGILWGSTVVSFEAQDEPARSALLRLLRSEPGRDYLVPTAQAGVSHLVKSDPRREHWHWMMRCQPGASWCFIEVAAIPEGPK